MTGVERQADQAMGGDDRGEVDLERRDAEALGRGGQVHADQAGIGAQRRQAEADAPGIVLAPGRAVGAQRARPARLGGVDRSLGGQLADLVGASRIKVAGGEDEIAENAGGDDQVFPVRRISQQAGIRGVRARRHRHRCSPHQGFPRDQGLVRMAAPQA